MKMPKKLIISASKVIVLSMMTAGLLFGGLLYFSDSPITLQSLESKTADQLPVFNRIQWFYGSQREVWMMNQSHHGLQAPGHQWDRLAIIVDKTTTPKTALFLQLPPGPLEWKEELLSQKINYRVSCFSCHANGPRALRPDTSQGVVLNPWQKIKIQAWNLRIKTYGRVVEAPQLKIADASLAVPFRHRADFDNETLPVKTCRHCHNENAWWSRGNLTRQNRETMSFMVQSQAMPPPGFSLTDSEKRELTNFLAGF